MSDAPSPATDRPAVSERLHAGPMGWVTVAGLAVMAAIALFPVATGAAVAGALVTFAAGAVVLVRTAPLVEVSGGELRAGPAHLPLDRVGAVQVLEGDALRHALGPGLDARAYVCLRGWIHTAVRVELDDPLDPTPYWIVSTRRPAQLAAALAR